MTEAQGWLIILLLSVLAGAAVGIGFNMDTIAHALQMIGEAK